MRTPLQGASVGVCIFDEAGNVVYQRNADQRLTPASNQKILSVAYALLALAIVFSITAIVRQSVLRVIGIGSFLFGGMHTGYLLVMGILSREPDFQHRMVLLFPIVVAAGAYAHLRTLDGQQFSRSRLRTASRLEPAG